MSETDDSDADRGLVTRESLLLAAVLFVGVAGTGVLRRELGLLGFDTLGRVVFVLGYGGMVFVVWYGWIRPLDITGPGGNVGTDDPSFDGDADDPESGDPRPDTAGAEGDEDGPRTPTGGRERDGRTER